MRAHVAALFVEREIFFRTNGHVRFVRITRAAQVRVAGLVGAVLLAWALVTVGLIGWQAWSTVQRTGLAAQRAQVARDAATVAAYRRGTGNVVEDLERRQAVIEQLVTNRLGTADAQPAPKPTRTTSALPTATTLAALAARQDAFALRLAAAFDTRSASAAQTLRSLGLNPAAGERAQGGPLTPWPPGGVTMTPALKQLVSAVARWSVLQDNLVALPSGQPTAGTPVTSSYGVRGDPFTGEPAFHAGLDFLGAYGQPITAAAAGRIVFVGQRSGYGNVVEVDHGRGLMTRYAHLSGFDVRPGQTVARGQAIARMGSTGRSTGTHLHFEVRVQGAPVNPRRFLALHQELADVQ